MRILHLSTHDVAGGAARAAYRVHQCLLRAGHDSRMFVRSKISKDSTVATRTDLFGRFYFQALPYFDRLYAKLQRTSDGLQRSFNPAPTFSLRRHIKPAEFDVVMLHFVGQGFLTSREIGRIRQPMVWLVHDMWPFCGAEHYTTREERFRQGYTRQNRPAPGGGLDLDRRLWRSKKKHWRPNEMVVLGASRWMSQLAQQSALLAPARHGVMPYPLNTATFKPQDKSAARKLFNLPQDRELVLFGAVGALKDPRKGFDLLVEAMRKVRTPAEVVIFGNRADDKFDGLGVPCHPLGMLGDDYSLAMLYSAADAMAAPSRIDNLPQTVLESLACGLPCAAFRVGGMPDMIENRENGILAAPFSTDELAAGLDWILAAQANDSRLADNARRFATAFCDEVEIGRRYSELFQSMQAPAPRS